jgi:predicted neuraminidase
MSAEKLSLRPASVNTRPGAEYSASVRNWQGIPGIERSANGRLLATWYSGDENEGPANYILLVISENEGRSWSDPLAVVAPPYPVRAFDPVLWHDPDGVLWWFWSQSHGLFDGRIGVWASRCLESSAPEMKWTKPQRIFDGIMMNKPLVRKDGTWLAAVCIWSVVLPGFVVRDDMKDLRFSSVYISIDKGASWQMLGQADVPNRQFDEHMIVERRDGSLWMLVRTYSGIGEARSHDGGRTWVAGKVDVLEGPCSRFFIQRLRSGRLLLVNHHRFEGRNNLTASLSDDEGRSWHGHLLLDERSEVSYPDGIETSEGVVYVVYDRERTKAKEILFACFTEADVNAGKPVSAGCRLKQLINKVPGQAQSG